MKLEEINTDWNKNEYLKKCDKCHKQFTLLTQPDNHPEYYTDVYLKCDCNNYILFVLPVN